MRDMVGVKTPSDFMALTEVEIEQRILQMAAYKIR